MTTPKQKAKELAESLAIKLFGGGFASLHTTRLILSELNLEQLIADKEMLDSALLHNSNVRIHTWDGDGWVIAYNRETITSAMEKK